MAKGKTGAERLLPLWQRLLLTTVGMVGVSFLVGLLWGLLFDFSIPSYASGVVGGLTALPIWEGLKRVRPKAGQSVG